jgi:hypothetical protein
MMKISITFSGKKKMKKGRVVMVVICMSSSDLALKQG